MELREAFNALLEKYCIQGKTLESLASQSGVTYNTIRRISQGTHKKPKFSTMLKLLRVLVPNRQEAKTFLAKYFSEETERLIDWPDSNIDETTGPSAKDASQTAIEVTGLASRKTGVSSKELIEELGKKSIRVADSLVECGMIQKNGDRYVNPGSSICDPDAIRAFIYFAGEKLREAEKLRGSIQIGALNDRGLEEARKILLETSKKLQSLRKQPEYLGSMPFVASVFAVIEDGNGGDNE